MISFIQKKKINFFRRLFLEMIGKIGHVGVKNLVAILGKMCTIFLYVHKKKILCAQCAHLIFFKFYTLVSTVPSKSKVLPGNYIRIPKYTYKGQVLSKKCYCCGTHFFRAGITIMSVIILKKQ